MPEEQYISPLRDRDGSDAYELALMLQYDLFSANTAAWHPGWFDSTVESIVYHYKEHGKEVGAKNATSYINKAVEFRRTAKKGSTKSKVKGETYGVIRYTKRMVNISTLLQTIE